jgi:hypothetical protein
LAQVVTKRSQVVLPVVTSPQRPLPSSTKN